MAERWVTVSAPGGLHARMAARIVRATRGVRARLTVEHEGRTADATSLTSLLALDAAAGSQVRVAAEGVDAESALEVVVALLGGRPLGRTFVGRGVSPGVGAGRAALTAEAAEEAEIGPKDVEGEIRRLHEAVGEAKTQLAGLEVWAQREIGGAGEILRAERELLGDPIWLGLVEARIRREQMTAGAAVRSVSHDPGLMPPEEGGGPPDGLREVLRDVGSRVARILAHQAPGAGEAGEGPIVLVAWQVSPSELLEWPRTGAVRPQTDAVRSQTDAVRPQGQLAGVVAVVGSAQAHAALVARALGVPMVVDVGAALLEAVAAGGHPSQTVRVDGTRGVVEIEPADRASAWGETMLARERVQPRRADLTGVGGERPTILANADTADEVRRALRAGAEGIGLVRTERLFLGRVVPPSEDEQYGALRAIAEACAGRPLALRLADLGGDKAPSYLVPLFGGDAARWRGAGLLARHPALAEPHLRALARVAREFAITLMVPMVATRDEWETILSLWRRVARGAGAGARISLLVETPAAALDLDRLLPEADEVAVGTNDLAALMFGADRGRGPTVPTPTLQPVMLRLMAEVVRRSHDRGLPVTVCGEAAGWLPEALVLWGMGVDGLSGEPGRVAALARAMRGLDGAEAREVAREVEEEGDVTHVWARLEAWRRELVSRGTTIADWPEGWEEHGVEHNDIGYNEDHRDDLGGGLA